MAYIRKHWVEGETSLGAANFNNIEDGVEEALTRAESNADAIEQVYTKTEADNKYRTISDSYTKSQVYTKQEADNKYRIKKVTVTGSTWELPTTVGKVEHTSVSYTIPSGYTPIGVSVDESGANMGSDIGVMLSIPGYIVFTARGTGSPVMAIPKATVYCIKTSEIITG